MTTATFTSYDACRVTSEKVAWQIEELLQGRRLDFRRPFLPETYVRAKELSFLSAEEKFTLNHIRGCGYLYTFGLVEEFILPFVMDHARADLDAGDEKRRALLGFAAEEAKHIELFRRFQGLFAQGFGSACAVIGPPQAIAAEVLSKPALAVALTILHIEWMTLAHYRDSIPERDQLDPMFVDLLHKHWLEESQHAKLDWLMIQEIVAELDGEELEAGLAGYLEVVDFFSAGMAQQARLDLTTLQERLPRLWRESEEQEFLAKQHSALNHVYLGSGMNNPQFLRMLEELHLGWSARVQEHAAQLP